MLKILYYLVALKYQEWHFLCNNNFNNLSRLKSNILYVTENSSQPSCLRILVSLEDKEEGKKKEKDHNPGFKMIKW